MSNIIRFTRGTKKGVITDANRLAQRHIKEAIAIPYVICKNMFIDTQSVIVAVVITHFFYKNKIVNICIIICIII
jgi:hypothetical protein